MKRVLILCEFGSLNGGERSLLAVLPYLAALGWESMVIAPEQGDFSRELAALGIARRPLPFDAADSRDKKRQYLADLLRRMPTDLLHANSLSMGRLSGPVAADLRLPSISHLRDMVKLSGQAVADLNRHGRLLAVSEATHRYHVNQGIDPDRCGVLYNGVDLAYFSPGMPTGYLHRELALSPETPLLAVIGQIGLRKGQDTLFEALETVFAKRPEPHLLVIGRRWSAKVESVEYERRLQERAAKPPLAGRVHFLGERDDMPLLLRELTLLVHPARQEPLGRVLLEAAAAGCCVAATDVGGTREIFPDATIDPVMTFVPPDNSCFLAKLIYELLDSPSLRRKMGNAARIHAERLFDIRISAKNLASLYDACFWPVRG